MTAHDPLCSGASRFPDHEALRDANCDCALIARAAERERLRAKVEALPYRTWVPPHALDCPGRPCKRGLCTCGDSLLASDWILRSEVLALLDGEPNG